MNVGRTLGDNYTYDDPYDDPYYCGIYCTTETSETADVLVTPSSWKEEKAILRPYHIGEAEQRDYPFGLRLDMRKNFISFF